jgi:hypothetical protein
LVAAIAAPAAIAAATERPIFPCAAPAEGPAPAAALALLLDEAPELLPEEDDELLPPEEPPLDDEPPEDPLLPEEEEPPDDPPLPPDGLGCGGVCSIARKAKKVSHLFYCYDKRHQASPIFNIPDPNCLTTLSSCVKDASDATAMEEVAIEAATNKIFVIDLMVQRVNRKYKIKSGFVVHL